MDAGSAWDGSHDLAGGLDTAGGSDTAGSSGDLSGPDEVGLLDRLERELEDAARVLRRLDEGTYATCEACGQPIGDDRLAISPVTRRCAEHDPNVAPSSAEG
jgi:hypothetical protein